MKKIAILGIAETGFFTSLSAKKLGFFVDCFDDYPKNNLLYLKKLKENSISTYSSLKETQKYDFAIKSPGIPSSSRIYNQFLNRKVDIKSEIDFIFPYLNNKVLIGITGTNGKTTTVKLLNHIIPCSFACGNIGYSLSRVFFEERKEKVLIIEISSFQLENSFKFKLDYSCLLNIEQDHLDRYESFTHYKREKIKILSLSKKSFADKDYTKNKNTDIIKLNQTKSNYINYKKHKIEKEDLQIHGNHNIRNILFSLSIVECLIEDKKIFLTEEEVIDKLKSFKAPKFCLEFIHKYKFLVINDSKSTNPNSLESAIETTNKIKNVKNFYLIMGGMNKNNCFNRIKKTVKKKFKKVFVYGSVGEDIKSCWEENINLEYQKDFKKTILACLKKAKINDCVLFSPACSSLDQFSSYKERGLYFDELIEKYFNNS